MTATIEFDNCRASLSGLTPAQAAHVRDSLTTYAPGYRYDKRYRNGSWNGKIRAIDRNLCFDTGFLPRVVELLQDVNLVDRRFQRQLNVTALNLGLRNYQMNAVIKALSNQLYGGLWWPRGVLEIATGGGKTRTAGYISRILGIPTIFLVHRVELVNQTREEFAELGVETGTVSEGEIVGKGVIVTTVQSLMSWAFESEYPGPIKGESDADFLERVQMHEMAIARREERGEAIRQYLSTVEQVFADEAHLTAVNSKNTGNLFVQAMRLMPRAYMRWGLTGTAGKREELHNWHLEGCTGSVLVKIKAKELIDLGVLARPHITMIRCKPLRIPSRWKTAEELGISANDERNAKVVSLCAEAEGPAVVIVNRVGHGEYLCRLAQRAGLKAKFLYGNVEVEERQQVWAALEAGQLDVVIATKIADDGIDVPSIQTLVIAGGGKSQVRTIQRLGRGLRRTKTKSEVKVYDFIDVAQRHLLDHSKKRIKTYIDEGHSVTEANL